MMTPSELLSRLEHRFDILRGGVRELPQRQQTLRGAIDWSYELLGDSTKKLFEGFLYLSVAGRWMPRKSSVM